MSEKPKIPLLAICGPTATGKSEIAVLVAGMLGGEIVNADSRQVYRDLAVGTGRPSAALMAQVPHHLYAFVDPCQRYNAGLYVADALAAIDGIVERGRVPIVVGGTGLYVEALAGTMPLDRPVADDVTRLRVRREAHCHPHEFLRGWLDVLSPEAARRIPPGDRYRTLRALEGALAGASAAAPAARASDAQRERYAMRVAVLSLDRALLAERIAARVRAMFDGGLADEAARVLRRCPNAPALTGLGYAEAIAWHRGEATRDEAIRLTVTRTVRYAKRQQTWFARLRDAAQVDAREPQRSAVAIAAFARETATPA